MKRLTSLVLSLFVLGLLSGCTQPAEAPPKTEKPTMADAIAKWQADRDAWFAAHPEGEQAPTEEELFQSFQSALNDWAAGQTLAPLESVTLDLFSMDSLLMDGFFNQKAYRNVTLEVGVRYDPAQVGDGSGFAAELEVLTNVADQIQTAVNAGAYAGRIKNLAIFCRDLNGTVQHSVGEQTSETRDIDLAFSVPAPQSDGDLAARTIAYDDVAALNTEYFSGEGLYSPYGEAFLDRFGVEPGSDTLQIEIALTMAGGADEAAQAAFKAGLEGRAKALADRITADPEARQYLTDQAVRTVTVTFDTPWERQGRFYYTYSFEM